MIIYDICTSDLFFLSLSLSLSLYISYHILYVCNLYHIHILQYRRMCIGRADGEVLATITVLELPPDASVLAYACTENTHTSESRFQEGGS